MISDLTVKRFYDDGDATLGEMTIDGEVFCFTLEDQHQDIKIAGETRIPAGRYLLKAIYNSGLAKKYKQRFGHDFVIGIEDVPGFKYIRIHCGNTDDHTDGCILVGMSKNNNNTISRSREAYKLLFEKLKDYVLSGDGWITIIDED